MSGVNQLYTMPDFLDGKKPSRRECLKNSAFRLTTFNNC